MKKILVLVFSNLKNDARVRRQIFALAERHQVTVVCFGAVEHASVNFMVVNPTPLTFFRKAITSFFLITRMYPIAWRLLHGYAEVMEKLAGHHFDLIVANDVETLPLAFNIDPNGKVLFDAHEYAPRHFEDKPMWRLFFQSFNQWMCDTYIPRVVAMTTVGTGLAREYEKNFGIKPTVITNANHYVDIEPSRPNPVAIRLVHHGIATRSRNLELMIELMDKLDERFTLDLMLLVPGSASAGTRGYIDELKAKATHNKRIAFIPAVPSTKVVETIARYDIGVFLLPPINFNYANTLPNKLFDFIQARLAIAIGPTPEMADIVTRYSNGVVARDFSAKALAEAVNGLSIEHIYQYKLNSGKAARELNAEQNKAVLNTLVDSIAR